MRPLYVVVAHDWSGDRAFAITAHELDQDHFRPRRNRPADYPARPCLAGSRCRRIILDVQRRFQYQFEWDPIKARRNLNEHGIAFERAATVFLDPEALSLFDQEHSQTEDRWITLGLDRAGTLLVVSHTYREETETSARIRLISARKATKNETKQYERK